MDAFAMWLGYLFMACSGAAIGLLVVVGFTRLVNFTVWRVVDCYGGLKTLREFQRWWQAKQRETNGGGHA